MPSFNELGLSPNMLEAVALLGYEEPTPIQQQAIPAVLAGRDVIAGAKTGTGKTAAFALPCMDSFEAGRKGWSPTMLVVTPTRELALQIGTVCQTIAQVTDHRILTVVGGVSYNPQIEKLRAGVDILIATPGRLLDLVNQDAVRLNRIRFFVLDEADRMLDMGFAPDIKKIAAQLPDQRQTLLFTATVDSAVEKSIGQLLHDPAVIETTRRGETADTVEQHVIRIAHPLKPALLAALLKEKGSRRVIVFARTRGRADTAARRLNKAGIAAAAIHSSRTQNQRQRAFRDFDQGAIDVIVATDVLSRGIDVQSVSYVVNYDIPMTAEDYVHRVGRTGRAGESGEAITFVCPENEKMLREIERLTKQKIPEMTVESFDQQAAEEEAAGRAIQATAKRDPEIAAAMKEMRAKEKHKAKMKAQAEAQTAKGGREGASRSAARPSGVKKNAGNSGKTNKNRKPRHRGKMQN